jgi:hypothetical protein
MHDAGNKVDPIDRLDPPEKFTALGDRPLDRLHDADLGWRGRSRLGLGRSAGDDHQESCPRSLIETPARIIIRSLHRTWGRVSASPVPRYSRRMRLLRAGSS